jgi:putative transposase
MRNLLSKVPRSAQPFVATLVRTVFAQPDAASTWAQLDRVVDQLQGRFAEVAAALVDMAPDLLAFTAFPKEHWRQIWSNNPQERLNKELRRRTDVVGIFPNRAAVIRLVGAVLAEQNDEWLVARRYMSPELLTKARLRVVDGEGADADDDTPGPRTHQRLRKPAARDAASTHFPDQGGPDMI